MSLYRKLVLISVGLAVAASMARAQVPTIDSISDEEVVSSAFMERPSVATDSKGQPHFVCDPGGNAQLMKFHRINGKWRGGVFATGSPGGPYSASRLYIGQMEIDSKDRAWISCKFGVKEYGSMMGQGVWLYRDITSNPVQQFFRHVNVYKGMGVVTIDSKYPDQGVVMGTFGNWQKLSQYGENLASGTINAGHGGEKVRAHIASYAPKYRTKDDTKAYPDGIWHTAMNGGPIDSMYQNSLRYQLGYGPVVWANKYTYPIMGDDYHHPGVGIDLTDPKVAYISCVFYGKMCINIWNGKKMLFPPTALKVLDDNAAFEIRHAPTITPAPGIQGGAFFFWTSGSHIKGVYVSKTGVVAKPFVVAPGRNAGAATDRYGNIHLVYVSGGIKYRKIMVSTLQGLAPKGAVTATRTPQFRWTNTKADRYTVEITKDGNKLPTATVEANTWTPGTTLGVGSYKWRVKEGYAGSANTWTPYVAFTIPPAIPEPLDPAGYFDAAFAPTFEWAGVDPEATRYTIELFKGANSQGTINATGDVKGILTLTANWPSQLTAGLYSWRIKATRVLAGYTVISDWSAETSIDAQPFQILVPGSATIVTPVKTDRFAPGNNTVACNWTPADGATAYKLKVLYNGTLLDDYNCADTNYTMIRFFQPGHHTLQVQPQNSSGNGPWSAPVTFTVTRDMFPANNSFRQWPPKEFEWTRSENATRYKVQLSKYNWATQKYVVLRTALIDQPKWQPKWTPAIPLPDGKYRWTVTDYFGKRAGYRSRSEFWINRP